MTVGITTILLILWTHWVSDFVLQSDTMAKNKSSSVKWLSAHVVVYSVPFLVIFGWKYAVINGILHWIVDFLRPKLLHTFGRKNSVIGFSSWSD